MMDGCQKCKKITAILLLVAGVGFLLADLDVWDFGSLSWYTVLFLIIGLTGFAKCTCKDCQIAVKKK